MSNIPALVAGIVSITHVRTLTYAVSIFYIEIQNDAMIISERSTATARRSHT